eukprot:6669476-Alexandrium_andersonii.AAC.1
MASPEEARIHSPELLRGSFCGAVRAGSARTHQRKWLSLGDWRGQNRSQVGQTGLLAPSSSR